MFNFFTPLRMALAPLIGQAIAPDDGWSRSHLEDVTRYHKGPYMLEPEDLDFDIYSAWFGTLELGEGSIGECKVLCDDHAATLANAGLTS